MTLSVRLCVTFSIQRNKESNVYCSLLSPYTSISSYVSILLRIRHVYGHLITPNIRYFMQCMRSREFHNSQEVLNAKAISLRQQGKGRRPNKAQPLTPDEESALWEKSQLGDFNGKLWYWPI